jgi:hypothetical protein
MAYTFNGSNQRASLSVATMSNYPYSLFVLARCANITTEGWGIGLCASAGPDAGSFLGFRGDIALDPTMLRRGNSGVNPSDATNGAAFSANTWYALGATLTSSSSVAFFKDGTKTTDTANIAMPSSLSFVSLGAFFNSSAPSGFLNGQIAYGAIWNVALTDAEQESLAKGFPPRRVRPSALYCEAVFARNAFNRSSSGTALSLVNAPTTVDHPRMYGV